MKKSILIAFLALPLLCIGQKKIKLIKNPVAWSYEIRPENPLNENLRNYQILVDTELDPMDFWDEISWLLTVNEPDMQKRGKLYNEAVRDTINKWADTYLSLQYPTYVRSTPSDFTISLSTDQFSVDNIQTDIDYSDKESFLGEINVSANLKVETADGQILLDKDIPYYIDDSDGLTTSLRLKHFVVNPSFKLKLKMTKKPEKRKRLLEKRIKKFEADILEYFMWKAGTILKGQYQTQQSNANSALFGVKSKDCEALNDASDIAEKAINSLSAFSKKKRKTLDEIRPDLEYARDYFTDKLTRTTHPTIQNALNANLGTVLLLLGDIEAAKFQIQNIPEVHELKTKTIWEGSFTYYIQGLAKAIALKERYGDRVTIYEY